MDVSEVSSCVPAAQTILPAEGGPLALKIASNAYKANTWAYTQVSFSF